MIFYKKPFQRIHFSVGVSEKKQWIGMEFYSGK